MRTRRYTNARASSRKTLRWLRWLQATPVLVTLSITAAAGASPSVPPGDLHADYAAMLARFVDEVGLVDYAGLKENRVLLDRYLGRLAGLRAQDVGAWPQADQIALYINAYNAFTLAAIVDHYPIEPHWLASLRFPENSIRQIAGVWDELRWTLAGQPMTLDHIEHKILRERFREPRIHMALVCASKGCPPLRREPYEGRRLDEQLDDQARRFLAEPTKFRIDRDANRVYLSPIFQWFAADFAAVSQASAPPPGLARSEQAVLGFLARYLGAEDAAFLRAGGYTVTYLDYDWSLNEQPPDRVGSRGQ